MDYAQPQSNLLAILDAHSGECQNWIYSNYIDLAYSNVHKFIEFLPFFEDGFLNCPWLTTSIMSRSSINNKYLDCIDFLIDCIDMERYIYGVFNVSHILHDKEVYPFHQIFIYGYDKEAEMFNVADFLFETKYSFKAIPFDDIRKAFYDVKESDDYLTFGGGMLLINYYPRGSALYQDLNIPFIINSISNFVNSENPMERYNMRFYPKEPIFDVFGLEIYNMIMSEHMRMDDRWDRRIAYSIYSHKLLMSKRIEYFVTKKLVSKDLLSDFSDILSKSNILVSLFLKANIVSNDKRVKIIKSVENIFNELKIAEINYYPKLIEQLKNHVK